ncbi:unnamed protein product [Brugia timori]|uniref:Uncharacterized protein n=1 Tax=Brugia timori TaxID=42155 RepID=A0A0R3QLV1_9BILA|nr:unnamed protein product [Brugia timori]
MKILFVLNNFNFLDISNSFQRLRTVLNVKYLITVFFAVTNSRLKS